ncbi:MAG TPA: DUF6011 domain-containing protein [Nitriliruptorales bacterium]
MSQQTPPAGGAGQVTGIAPAGRGLPGLARPRQDDRSTAYSESYAAGRRHAERRPVRAATYLRSALASPVEPTVAVRGRNDGIAAGLADQDRCRRCGRRLTVTSSIAAGIGPDCAAHLQAQEAAGG